MCTHAQLNERNVLMKNGSELVCYECFRYIQVKVVFTFCLCKFFVDDMNCTSDKHESSYRDSALLYNVNLLIDAYMIHYNASD